VKITRTTTDTCVRLALDGRLDASWSEHAGAALDEAIRSGRSRLELDLAAVNFISSVGIGVILRANARLRAVKGTLVVVAASASVRDMLRISRLEGLIHTEPVPEPRAAAAAPIIRFGRGWHGELEAIAPEQACGAVEFLAAARLTLDTTTFALGHLALANSIDEARGYFGEGLAAGATIAVAPAHAPRPDCLASASDGRTPHHFVSCIAREALVARGTITHVGHFERSATDPIGLRDLASSLVDAVGGPIAFCAIGECGGAFGAWARVSPDLWTRPVAEMTDDELRANLRFAGEPMHAGESLAVVAVAAPHGGAAALPASVRAQLADCGPCLLHAHLATVSYRPVPRNTRDILAAGALLAEQPLRSVMHALHAQGADAGAPAHPSTGSHAAAHETQFVRGSAWVMRLAHAKGGAA
jgi:anti-anti-sigma factor